MYVLCCAVLYVCMSVCMCVYVSMYACTYVYVIMHVYNVCMYECMYIRRYVCLYVCMNECMYVCSLTHVHVCVCVRVWVGLWKGFHACQQSVSLRCYAVRWTSPALPPVHMHSPCKLSPVIASFLYVPSHGWQCPSGVWCTMPLLRSLFCLHLTYRLSDCLRPVLCTWSRTDDKAF